MSRELQHKHTMDQFKEVCNGTNCRASKAMPYHSEECRAEHDALHENRRASPTSVPEGYVLVPVEIIDRFQELNPSNYDHDDVCALNAWAVELVLAAAPTPPVSEDRKDAEHVPLKPASAEDIAVYQQIANNFKRSMQDDKP